MLQGRESAAASKIQLLPGEKILLRGSCVRHGFWDAYTDELVLTNMAFVHISRGLFGNYKDTVRYPFDSVSQIVVGEASNGEKQLEVYHPGGQDDFAFQSGNKRVMKVWELAINDQMSDSGSSYDSAYYSDLPDLAEKEKDNEQTERVDENGVDASFVGNVAKSVLSSGDLSMNGVMRGVKRTAKKQAFSKAATGIIGGLGVGGGDLLSGSDMRASMGFQQRMEQAKMERRVLNDIQGEPEEPDSSTSSMTKGTMFMQEQLELLKKLKELLDMGALTQEEFDKKKRQIMEM